MKTVKIIRLLLASALFCASLTFAGDVCLAQSTNDTKIDEDVRLSISLTNNVIPIGSAFCVLAEITNTSTNVIYISESTPEQDFLIYLTGASGTVYQISPTPFRVTRSMVRTLSPGDKHDWTINAWVSRYFEPPGYTATHQNVPEGNYTLKVTTKIATQFVVFKAESNVIGIQIK